MSRADEMRARVDAEAEVLELEDELLAAKESGEVDRGLKLRLRDARRRFREARSGGPAGEGDAVASPATVTLTAAVQEG